MTTTTAWEVDCASGQAAAKVAADCLHDGPVGTVGLEIEAHCFDMNDPLRRPGWDELSDVIAAVPTLPGGSAVTVEPGGAVELSGPPACGPADAITGMAADRSVLQQHFAAHGLGLVLLGADPLRPARRINPGARRRCSERVPDDRLGCGSSGSGRRVGGRKLARSRSMLSGRRGIATRRGRVGSGLRRDAGVFLLDARR